MKGSQKALKHPKGVFRAQKTLQRFGYSVAGQSGAPFLNLTSSLVERSLRRNNVKNSDIENYWCIYIEKTNFR